MRQFYSYEERERYRAQKQAEATQQIKDLAVNWKESPENIAEYLAFSSRLHTYSARNTMLIYKANPNTLFPAAYKTWESMGYHVRKNEHGISISVYAPVTYFLPNSANTTWQPLKYASPEQKHQIEIGMLPTREIPHYKQGTVFDISQTDCPIEDYPKICGLGYNSLQHREIYEVFCRYSEKIGMPVVEDDFRGVATFGTYNMHSHEITINELLGDTQKLSTLLHEMSHGLMQHKPDDSKSTMQHEFEADSLSIMFANTYDIKITDARKSHLANCYRSLISADANIEIDKLLTPVTEKYSVHLERMNAELSLSNIMPIMNRIPLQQPKQVQAITLKPEMGVEMQMV